MWPWRHCSSLYSLINKNSLISFSVYLKQFDMNTKKKKKENLVEIHQTWVVAQLMILGYERIFFKFVPISTTKLRTFLKTRFSNEACLAAGGRHFGRCLHYVVSITHDLVTLEIKSSIACILRISRLLIPLVRPKRWQGMMKVREQTLGQKERCDRQRGDEEMAEQRDKVIGWRTIEQRPC